MVLEKCSRITETHGGSHMRVEPERRNKLGNPLVYATIILVATERKKSLFSAASPEVIIR